MAAAVWPPRAAGTQAVSAQRVPLAACGSLDGGRQTPVRFRGIVVYFILRNKRANLHNFLNKNVPVPIAVCSLQTELIPQQLRVIPLQPAE